MIDDLSILTQKQKIAIRSQIIAPKDKLLLAVDFSQGESWFVAYLANEKTMKHELQFGDIHARTARAIYKLPPEAKKGYLMSDGQRYIGKKSNHANSYRQGYLMYVVSVNSESDKPPYIVLDNKEGKRHHDIWHDTYNIKPWWLDLEESLRRDHYLVTPYRRKRNFYSPLGNELYKEATAYIPQSSLADHTFGRVQKETGIEGGLITVLYKVVYPSKGEIRLINTSHDSAILEVPKECINEIAEAVVNILRRPVVVNGEQFTIPVEAEQGYRWGEGMEKIKIAA